MQKYTIKDIKTKTYGSDTLKETLLESVKDENEIIYNPSYTNYGGSFVDKVLIEWAKKYHSSDIIFESTSWGGQNAYIFGETAKDIPDDFYYMDDFYELYDEMDEELRKDAVNDILSEMEIDDDDLSSDIADAIDIALSEYGQPCPNSYDYCTPKIIERVESVLSDEKDIEISIKDYMK